MIITLTAAATFIFLCANLYPWLFACYINFCDLVNDLWVSFQRRPIWYVFWPRRHSAFCCFCIFCRNVNWIPNSTHHKDFTQYAAVHIIHSQKKLSSMFSGHDKCTYYRYNHNLRSEKFNIILQYKANHRKILLMTDLYVVIDGPIIWTELYSITMKIRPEKRYRVPVPDQEMRTTTWLQRWGTTNLHKDEATQRWGMITEIYKDEATQTYTEWEQLNDDMIPPYVQSPAGKCLKFKHVYHH